MNKAALVFLILSMIVSGAETIQANASEQPSVPAIGKVTPRFNVTQYGAVGNRKTDDTAAIQAAFDACANYVAASKTLTGVHGGIVEFPGLHTYVISSTINAYDGCRIEGSIGYSGGGQAIPRIAWHGSEAGTIYTITGFTTSANTTPLYTQSSPKPYYHGNLATFTVSGGSVPSVGEWVEIEGLHTRAGLYLNRVIAQVAAAGGNTFTVTFPSPITAGTFTDTGTVTTVNVMVAFDANARYNTTITNICLASGSTHPAVGFYFGSRVDTGTRLEEAQVAGMTKYSYYFAAGGINIDFDHGWRSDGAGIAGIYWRVTGGDNFGIANGTTDNATENGSSTGGGAVMLDNSACIPWAAIRLTARNIKHEINTTMPASGLGVYTLIGCPSVSNRTQFFLDFEQVWMSPSSFMNAPGIVMIPASDAMASLTLVNTVVSGGGASGTTGGKFVGLPTLSRNDVSGAAGIIPLLSYNPPTRSSGTTTSAYSHMAAPIQFIGDTNINQLYQYGVAASAFLYSDTAYASLPNGTTLYAGQILAPPSYWNGANSKRYAIDVVYQAGTKGTPNGGATTCSGARGTFTLTCSSATDLSQGQRISIGTDSYKEIDSIDATNPSVVLVSLAWNNGSGRLGSNYTNKSLSFSAPVLGPEIQLPTKSSAAPTALAWSQGDIEQNSGATANGIAAWVNIAAGTPGKWAGIPLGDSNGKITASQLSSARTAQAFCAGTASSSSTLLLFGAGTSQTACTQVPGPQTLQQVLLTTDGVLSNLAVRCGHPGSQPSSGTFTVWDLPSGAAMSNAVSGINTGLIITIGNAAGNANKTLIDTRHTYTYAAGDMIRIQFTTQANETLADCTASFNY